MALTEKYLDVENTLGSNSGTEANPWQSWNDALPNVVTGQRLNVKAPSTRATISTSNIVSGAASPGSGDHDPIHIRGYSSTIGDGGIAEFATLTLKFNANYLVEGIDIANSASKTPANGAMFTASGMNTTFYRCKASKTGDNAQDIRMFDCQQGGNVVNCHCLLSAGDNANSGLEGCIDITNGVAYANIVRITDFVGSGSRTGGIKLSSSTDHSAAAVRNLVFTDRSTQPSFGVAGIVCEGMTRADQGGYHITNNTIDNFIHGIQMFGVGLTSSPGTPVVTNNLITSCPTACYGMTTSVSPPQVIFVNNAVDGVIAGVVPIDLQRITKDPYNDAANKDFTLNAVRGGGAVCRSRAACINGSLDIGALAI